MKSDLKVGLESQIDQKQMHKDMYYETTQAALAKQEKISDVMIRHVLTTRGNHYSRPR